MNSSEKEDTVGQKQAQGAVKHVKLVRFDHGMCVPRCNPVRCVCMRQFHDTRPGLWFIRCMRCTIVYRNERIVSTFHEHLRENIGLDYSLKLMYNSIKLIWTQENSQPSSKSERANLVVGEKPSFIIIHSRKMNVEHSNPEFKT